MLVALGFFGYVCYAWAKSDGWPDLRENTRVVSIRHRKILENQIHDFAKSIKL